MKNQAPVPVRREERICFGIAWFATEEEADAYDKIVRERGYTYNGGYMHGVPCGRDKTYDYTDKETGEQRFAVTN